MNFEAFKIKAVNQDKRNVFGVSYPSMKYVPESMRQLYSVANPLDVEVQIDGNSVIFFPYEQLIEIKDDYNLGDDNFVFASCNGDPIYLYEGKVYTQCHGIRNPQKELLAESIENYLDMMDE